MSEAVKVRKPRAKKEYVPSREYSKPPIPYAVSQPNKFWRIRKDLPPADYWRKRYYRRRITGKGAYTMDPNQSFGQRYGGYIGSLAGEYLGGAAQSLIKSVTGLGAYSVRRNVFMEGRLPEVVNQPAGGGTVIRFQEYLGDVVTSSVANGFSIQNFTINAANPVTFPFLSQIAANYEQYDFEGLLYEFRSTSADALNSVNTALGAVMMATQYDDKDAVFASKLEMLNYEYSTAIKPSENCMHMVECDPRQTTVNELYTLYSSTAPANSDSRLYNLGRFSVATQGFQGTSVNVGQLHVTYQVRLLKPKLFTSLGSTIPMYVSRIVQTTAYDNANPFGTVTTLPLISIVKNTANIRQDSTHIYFDNQNTSKLCFLISLRWSGGLTAVSAPLMTASSGSLSALVAAGAGTQYGPAGGESCTSLLNQWIYQTDGLGVAPVLSMTTSGLTLPSAGNSMTIRIVMVDPSMGVLWS